MPFSRRVCGLLWLGILSSVSSAAEPAGQAGEPASAAASSAEIETWIKQLNSDRFEQRGEASKQLEAAGKAAFPALAEAAIGEAREVTLRAIEILRKHFEHGDAATKEAARKTLQKIVDSQHESASQRAQDVLTPPAKQPAAPMFQAVPGLQLVPGQVQIQVQAAGKAQTRQVRINNGVKQIDVSEDGRKVQITDDPAQGIKIEVTESKDGKETKQKYSAKNADELKKKHPEGYQVYDKYAQQPGGMQIQVQGGGGAFGFPQAIPVPLLPDQPQRQVAGMLLRQAKQMVESAAKHLERTRDAAENKDELTQSLKRLAEIGKQIEDERAKLEKLDE